MTKNADYEISISEVITLLKRRWKIICILMLVFVVLCGGYKAISSRGAEQAGQSYEEFEKDKAFYDYSIEIQQDFPDSLKADWERTSYDKVNNPIFSVDPYKCEYDQIVIRFNGEDSNYGWTVSNWIFSADNKKLFGNNGDSLADYKSSLIVIGQNELDTKASDTAVQIIKVEGFDTKQATDYLIDHFKACSVEDNVVIEGLSESNCLGYNHYVDNYQQRNIIRYNSLYANFANSKSFSSYITEPVNPDNEKNGKLNDIIKFCLIGLILGFVIGIVFILFEVIYKREIISAKQIERAFDLELLSDFSSGHEASLDVLNANLDLMTGVGNKIAVIVDNSINDVVDIPSKWTEQSDRSYILCTDIFDNPDMIEGLRNTDGIVIGVKIDKSKPEHIQKVILRANKLNIKVLGFVLL